MAKYYYLLLITLVVIVVGQVKVEGDVCEAAFGACGGAGSCDQRCKAQHSDGEGLCNLGLCTCSYSCGPSPGKPKKICTTGLGVCGAQCNEACCNSKCASSFKQGAGFCTSSGSAINLCTCQYTCGL